LYDMIDRASLDRAYYTVNGGVGECTLSTAVTAHHRMVK